MDFLRRLLGLPELQDWQVTVRGVEGRLKELMVDSEATVNDGLKQRFIANSTKPLNLSTHAVDYPEGTLPLCSPLQAVLVSVEVSVDEPVVAGQELAVVEAMKMQHVIKAPSAGVVVEIFAEPGITLDAGQAILLVRPRKVQRHNRLNSLKQDLSLVRPT